MKIYKTQAEVDADIKDNVLTVRGDVSFEFNLKINASIVIEAGDIRAWDIEAWNIEALNINSGNIEAWNINSGNIEAGDIMALNIKARDIKARDISFYAVAFAYIKFKCKSIVSRRENSKYFCLDSDVEITG